jgi:hypothetical protein
MTGATVELHTVANPTRLIVARITQGSNGSDPAAALALPAALN